MCVRASVNLVDVVADEVGERHGLASGSGQRKPPGGDVAHDRRTFVVRFHYVVNEWYQIDSDVQEHAHGATVWRSSSRWCHRL
jgi:hypothetical protein